MTFKWWRMVREWAGGFIGIVTVHDAPPLGVGAPAQS
jgi:hypothetical protein